MTSVTAGRSAGTALGSYLDSLTKTASGAVSQSGRHQSESTDGATSDTTSPSSVVSLSPRAKAMLAQAKDAQTALETLKALASKNGSSEKASTASRSGSTSGTIDPAGAIYQLITNGGETAGFVASGSKSGAESPF